MNVSGTCSIYQQSSETLEHALLYCQWTRPVWFGLQLGVRSEYSHDTNIAQWLETQMEDIYNLPCPKAQKEFALTSLSTTLWGIWKSRNEAIFERKKN